MTPIWPQRILLAMTRPNPLLWIWYTLGGKLGSPYREWVLHDVTCRTRWLRQTVRAVAQIAVPAAVVSVALTGLGMGVVVLGGVACGALLGLWYSLAYIDQTGDRRLVKNGYEPGTLKRVLRERYDREHGDQIVRYMQTYRKAG
jgi:Family of unknown function (DUF5313)